VSSLRLFWLCSSVCISWILSFYEELLTVSCRLQLGASGRIAAGSRTMVCSLPCCHVVTGDVDKIDIHYL
jgi:hypothetical protein